MRLKLTRQARRSRTGKRIKRVLGAAHGSWEIIVLDSPRQLSLRQWAGEIRPEREWKFLEYITSHLGSLSARKRNLAIWGAPPEFALEGLKVTPHPSLSMLPLDPKSPAARVEGTLVQEPTLVTTGDRWLPHPYGHVRHRGADLLVHSVKGPAGAFTGVPHPLKAHGGILIPHDAGGVRALTDGEVLACQGVYPQVLPEQITADHCTLMKLAVLGPGWQAAGAILGLLDVPLKESGKTGNCLDPDELLADQQLQIWLEAWKRNKEDPRQELDLVPASWEPPTPLPSAWTDTERCGGTPRKRADHSLVIARMLGEERERFFASCSPCPKRGQDLADLDDTAQEAILSKLADSTRKSYGTGWKQWQLFLASSGRDPFLSGETRAERLADEQWLIRFVVFLHQRMGRTAQGIRQRLSGIRCAHISSGFPDPLQGRVRLWAAIQGLHRWDGPQVRKIPVTVEMLRWLRSYLLDGGRDRPEAAALWSAVCLGWFFMLRASEYLPPQELSGAPPRVLKGRDLEFFGDSGVRCSVWEATVVVLQLREAKNDQFSRGQVRTHHLTGSPICPVLSLRDHARFNPHWIRDPASPVFACKGKGITREDISALLRVCSIALGYPPELVGSHSLRKGGATALFAATGNMELVKRFGGWKSDAVHAYLYSDLHGGEQHGTHMLRSKPALQPQQRSRSTPAHVNHSQASDCRAGCIDSDAPSMHVASPIVCSLDVTSRSRSPFCHWCIIALGLSIGAPPFPFTFIAGPVMAAEPPAPWTDRRMKDWLLEGNNAWDILGVPPGSDLADILRAFRRLSIRYHPDKQLHKTQNEQAESARQYLLISQSRDILTHPTMRALHDDLTGGRRVE